MATRSRIAVEKKDGSVQSIYCHFDGYPSHNGEILLNHYDYERALKLIKLGDISILGRNLDETHAYTRDRGEDIDSNKAITHTGIKSFFNSDIEEWGYLITTNGEWLFKAQGHKNHNTLNLKYINEFKY